MDIGGRNRYRIDKAFFDHPKVAPFVRVRHDPFIHEEQVYGLPAQVPADLSYFDIEIDRRIAS
jgi:hypothetical protein